MMFGKLLALIGVVMIGIGIVGMFRTGQSFNNLNLGNTMQLATDPKAREAQLCKPGEKLEEDQGPSVYTPGHGYGRPTQSYCVDSEGNRRDVTGEFVDGMLGQVDGMFSGVFSSLAGTVINFALIGFGLVLAIIGLLLGRRRSLTPATNFGVPAGTGVIYTTANPQNQGGPVDLNQVIQQARNMKAAVSGDLSTRLKQLEDARNAGLISQTEYDRTRQQILDALK